MALVRGPRIVRNGLVLHLDAAQRTSYSGSGTAWNDLSGNRNNATLTNGPTFNSANGGSIVFDGVDDYASLSSAINLSNTFTLLSWIKTSTLTGGDYIVYGSDANGADNWFGINGNAVNLFATQIADVNNFTLKGGTIASTSIWYFIGATVNVDTVKVYLNGIEQNSVVKAFTIGAWNSSGNSIGRRGTLSQRYFPGNIANVAIYSRVLTASEILQNYNTTKGRFNL